MTGTLEQTTILTGLDTNAYYALGAPICLGFIFAEYFITRKKGMKCYRFGDTISNLSGGLGEVIIGLFIGIHLFALYEYAYQNWALIQWPTNSIVSWLVAFLAADCCYYWYHRAGHSIAAFWAIHGVHHQSEEFNITVGIRHPWFSDYYSSFFYFPLPLLGIETVQFFIAISVISFYALTVHSKVFQRSTFYIFTSPATHIIHHCRNPEYFGKNLGAMFTLWDRLFGTHVELRPDNPPDVGPLSGYRSHDGAKAQWLYFSDIFYVSKQQTGIVNKLKPFIKHPGWRPPNTTLQATVHAKDDALIPKTLKIYVACEFFILTIFSLYILWFREQHTGTMQVMTAILVLWGISTLGGLLDGRSGSGFLEFVRLTSTLVMGLILLTQADYFNAAIFVIGSSVISILVLFYFRIHAKIDSLFVYQKRQ